MIHITTIALAHKIYGWFTIIITVFLFLVGLVFSSYFPDLTKDINTNGMLNEVVLSMTLLIVFSLYNLYIERIIIKEEKHSVFHSYLVIILIFSYFNSSIDIVFATFILSIWVLIAYYKACDIKSQKSIKILTTITLLPVLYFLNGFLAESEFEKLSKMVNMKEHLKLQEYIQDHNVNIVDSEGYSVLMSTLMADEKTIQILIAGGLDLNYQGVAGNTALHYAIEHEIKYVYNLLLPYDQNLSIKNNKRETALELAIRIRDAKKYNYGKDARVNIVEELKEKELLQKYNKN